MPKNKAGGAKPNKFRIAVIPGDGIGNEVVPEGLRVLEAAGRRFDIDFKWIIDAAARRQKWIDQAQSVNLWIKTPDLKTLSHMYRQAWHVGLKTTYYLRTMNKSAIDSGNRERRAEKPQFTEAEKMACSIEAMRSPVTNEGSEMLKLQALKPESSEAQSGASRSLVDDGADREGLSDEDFARIQPSLAVLQRVQETAEDSGDLTLLARVDEERRRLRVAVAGLSMGTTGQQVGGNK